MIIKLIKIILNCNYSQIVLFVDGEPSMLDLFKLEIET